MKHFETITAGAPTSRLPFSPAVAVSGLLVTSGQASVSATGEIIPGTFEQEMRRSMGNLERVLQAANSSLARVFYTRCYVACDEDLARFNEIYREYFSEPCPARTTLTKCLGAGLKFEIEAMALREES